MFNATKGTPLGEKFSDSQSKSHVTSPNLCIHPQACPRLFDQWSPKGGCSFTVKRSLRKRGQENLVPTNIPSLVVTDNGYFRNEIAINSNSLFRNGKSIGTSPVKLENSASQQRTQLVLSLASAETNISSCATIYLRWFLKSHSESIWQRRPHRTALLFITTNSDSCSEFLLQ